MKVLVTGAGGQTGRCVLDRLPASWSVLACQSGQLNITDASAVEHTVCQFRPDIIINAAAYTAVDKAESCPEEARQVNAMGPENLAISARRHHARLIHISTDYVFDGSQTKPYQENDPTAPLNVYGQTKREGEQRVLAQLDNAVILRTSWVFSEYGNNFVSTMLRLAATHDTLRIVSDQIGCPTYAGDLAQAAITLASRPDICGLLHYCGATPLSWYQFAEKIFQAACDNGHLTRQPELQPITTADYPTPAQRPVMSVLNREKADEASLPASPLTAILQKIC